MSLEHTTYAIIQSGGKQYRVAAGDIIDVELLGSEPKDAVEFDQVLFVFDGQKAHVGVPVVAGYIVKGELVTEIKGPKVIAYKYRRRKDSRKKVGHRQHYSRVKITHIAG